MLPPVAFSLLVLAPSPAFFLPHFGRNVNEAGSISPLVTHNVLTRKQLDTLKFTSKSVDAPESYANMKLGMWLAKSDFREEEPVYALLAIKNDGTARGMDGWLSVSARSRIHWNAAGIRLTFEKTLDGSKPKYRKRLTSHIWACGNPRGLAWIRGKSYLSLRVDLRGYGLKSGHYSGHWGYGKLRSNQIRFRVLPPKHSQPGAKKKEPEAFDLTGVHGHNRWIRLNGKRTKEGTDPKTQIPFRELKIATCAQGYFQAMSATLATGHVNFATGDDKRWYPDIYDLPTKDKLLRVSARFLPAPDKNKPPRVIEMEFRPINKDAAYSLGPVDMHLVLLIFPQKGAERIAPMEGKGAVRNIRRELPPDIEISRKASAGDKRPRIEQNLTLRVELPEDWTRLLDWHGPSKCAVLVSTEPVINMTQGAILRKITHRISTSAHPPWQGLVRTPWIDFDTSPN